MNRMLEFIIFFSFFLGVYAAMNYYAYLRLDIILGSRPWLMPLIILLGLSFPLLSVTERFMHHNTVRYAYIMSTIYLGVLFFMIVAFALLDLAHLGSLIAKSSFNYQLIGLIALIIVILVSGYSMFNATQLNIKKISVPGDDELKIVQLSDIHVGTIHTSRYLKKIVRISNEQEPDIVAITGDLFDGSDGVNKELIMPLKDLKARLGVYFVTGNHETYLETDKIVEMVRSLNVTVLRNEMTEAGGVQIIGIDNPTNDLKNNIHHLKNMDIDKKKTTILLYHTPIGVKEASEAGVDLMLSGHTHNGQIWPFDIMVRLFFRYVKGLYEVGDMHLYLSPGAGTWGPPMRLGSRSEISVIEMK
ncbi:metallophosphoesterase [Candidatus Woesearchaeota archaeon]|nr:metallophosphoesterase [Candidatus Woesearchaeota archaeon]